MSIYKKLDYETGRDTTVLQCNPLSDKLVQVKPNLPGAVIVIHGVNDMGVGYVEVEKGLCAGLGERLDYKGRFQSANYRMPTPDDKDKLEPDPDAVFFKRQLQEGHHTPVIPFYWGFREAEGQYKTGAQTSHGQAVDFFGNRLDKDFSKGGGPFANATNTLADMWNRGFGAEVADRISKDPIRPVLKAPGRLYMILAAKRLAALISMIRDYDKNEVVSLVAHSQGCMLSLLAQAFLMQKGLRPADTLVLTHPPYGLVDDLPLVEELGELFSGGEDESMHDHYRQLSGRQTLHARLQSLANIVQGVVAGKHATPALAELPDHCTHRGMVGSLWTPGDDRDNRGKVYLYFCPEDRTVALYGMQGIGWQGVPDYIEGQRVMHEAHSQRGRDKPTETQTREALKELGPGFLQRVFTAKLRSAPGASTPQPVRVGAGPHDFILRLKGEDDFGHADTEVSSRRAHLPEVDPHASTKYVGLFDKSAQALREGIRRITGEPLKTPVKADMYAGGLPNTMGKREAVDPIDAAISTTSRDGLELKPQVQIDDPRPASQRGMLGPYDALNEHERDQVAQALNQGKEPGDCCTIERGSHFGVGKLLIIRHETPNEARLRQQTTGSSARSFHSAIFGSSANHAQVTAYDIAIGGGKAVTDPLFYGYLCAMADWRLKKPADGDWARPGILLWEQFTSDFSVYYSAEPPWRKALIEGNCTYYSTGKLPDCLPVLPAGLPPTVVSETMSGQRIEHPPEPKPVKKAEAEPLNMGEWMAKNPLPKDLDAGSAA